jgi:alpha-tubulin suppressor-like RCC1 family protein
MRAALVRIGFVGLAALLLGACTDSSERLLAPPSAPDKLFVINWQNRYDLVEITAGSQHTCARRRDGTMFCWGDNSFAQIGVASTATCGRYGYGLSPCVPTPAVITGSGTVNGVSTSFTWASTLRAGGNHTCALQSGAAWCWGVNWNGEVGIGTGGLYNNVTTPTPVSGGLTFSQIDVGSGATCGITNNLLYCWGNISYQLGSPYTPTLYSWLSGWVRVTIGGSNACAYHSTSGWACWGDNQYGQIGLDHVTWPYMDGPLGLPVIANAQNMEEGGGFICADQPDGTVQCIGKNDVGQLGDPTLSDLATTQYHTVGGTAGLQLHGVTTGYSHACALDPSGAAFCWGGNGSGQIGSGVVGNIVRTPTAVLGGHTFRALAAGMYHTCGIGTDNRIYCWGDNFRGQLGIGAGNPSASSPVLTM